MTGIGIDEAERQTKQAVRAMFEHGPADYEQRAALAQAILAATHNAIGTLLAPSFNARLREMDKGDVASRRELCAWANAQLRPLGLAIECQRTHRPTHLTCDFRDHKDHTGRFRLEYRDDQGNLVRTMAGVTLPEFVLTKAPPRVESLSKSFRQRNDSPQGR